MKDLDSYCEHLAEQADVDAGRLGAALHVIRLQYSRWGCLLFASALARANPALDVAMLKARDMMGHAVVVVGSRGAGMESLLCADVAGVWTISELRRTYTEVHGRLALVVGGPSAPDPRFDEPDEVPLAVAGRLPWLKSLVPERFRETDPAVAATDLIELGEGLHVSRAGGAITDEQEASVTFRWIGPWFEERERRRTDVAPCR